MLQVNSNFIESTARTKFSQNKLIQAEISRIAPRSPKGKPKQKKKDEEHRTVDKMLRWMETPVTEYIHC